MGGRQSQLGWSPIFLLLLETLSKWQIYATADQYDSEMQRLMKFKPVQFFALLAGRLETHLVNDVFDCVFLCEKTKKCLSFNIQVEPDKNGHLFQCELLDKDMFHSREKFQANGTFHHYAIQTPCMEKGACKHGGICLPDYQTSGFQCKCIEPYTGRNCDVAYKNCADYFKAGNKTNGVYAIRPDRLGAFDVFCDQITAGGGWTVFQKRLDGSVDFFRGWADYKQGFGNLNGEFWLGLDKIHRLTSQTNNKLRVELEDFDGNTAYAEYDSFTVTNEATKYQLNCGRYSGTAGDSLLYHYGMAFTTKDRDNDENMSMNCAERFKGAWWYKACHNSNLNGLYHGGQHSSYADGVNWHRWKGFQYSAKRAKMKFRPVDF